MINPVDQFYPGLQVWAKFFRQGDGLSIFIFDREVSKDVPVYVIPANKFASDNIANLTEESSYCLPGMTYQKLTEWASGGNPPEGYSDDYYVYRGVNTE